MRVAPAVEIGLPCPYRRGGGRAARGAVTIGVAKRCMHMGTWRDMDRTSLRTTAQRPSLSGRSLDSQYSCTVL